MCNRLVAYYRVSTKAQQNSGLGLDAQSNAVASYASANGKEIIAHYVEQESGGNNERPELNKAIARAKREKAQLTIAKLDRLSRNLAFIAQLMESGVPFVCCDMPFATPLTLHIMGAMAEHEKKMVSDRTIASLKEAKKRGVLLGSARENHWTEKNIPRRDEALARGRKKSAMLRHKTAKEQWNDVLPLVRKLFRKNLTYLEIGKELERLNYKPVRGEHWHATTVQRLLKLAGLI